MDGDSPVWKVDGVDIEITCDEAVMESMRQAAMVGLQKIPRRGLEIGGILFGVREGACIRIHQWREIPCEHAKGPGFDLSANDEAGLEQMISDAAEDPKLLDLTPVGWFRSRTRDKVYLSETDLRLFDRFFPEPSQIALVIRPFIYEPAQAGFFVREADGRIQADESRGPFELENKRRKLPLGFDPSQPPRRPEREESTVWAPAPERPAVEPPAPPETETRDAPPPAPAPAPVLADGRAEQPAGRGIVAPVVAGLLVLLTAVVLILPALDERDAGQVDLRVRDLAGHLIVEWNPRAEPVTRASQATLHILDAGRERRIDILPDELSGGALVYQRVSGDVNLHFELFSEDGGSVFEIARFLGSEPIDRPAVDPNAPMVQLLKEEVVTLEERLAAETARTERLRRSIDAKKRQLGSAR
jgi:hypothetical protein